MSKTVQIRDVPGAVHSILKARAKKEGMSLSDFLKRELEQSAERPSLHDWLEGTRQLAPIPSTETPAQVIRELRDSR